LQTTPKGNSRDIAAKSVGWSGAQSSPCKSKTPHRLNDQSTSHVEQKK
jgi:hypothetical protein